MEFNDTKRRSRLQTHNKNFFKKLRSLNLGLDSHVEYGAWMLELVPNRPIFHVSQIQNNINNFYNLLKILEHDKEH